MKGEAAFNAAFVTLQSDLTQIFISTQYARKPRYNELR